MYYLTLKPLTEGILEVGADRVHVGEKYIFFHRVKDPGYGLPPLPEQVNPKDCHHTLEAAQARVAELVAKEKAKLTRKIESLDAYKPDVRTLP